MLGEVFDTFIFILLAADLLIWRYIFVSWLFIDQALYLCCEYIGVLDISLLAACRSFHEIVHCHTDVNRKHFTKLIVFPRSINHFLEALKCIV